MGVFLDRWRSVVPVVSALLVVGAAPAGADPEYGTEPLAAAAPGPVWTTDVAGQLRASELDTGTGTVLVAGNHEAIAYSAAGTELWRIPIELGRPVLAVDALRGVFYVVDYEYVDFEPLFTVAAYDALTGQELWRTSGGFETDGNIVAIEVDEPSGRVFLTGLSGPDGDRLALTQALSPAGESLWQTRSTGADPTSTSASVMALAPDGDTVYVSGYSDGNWLAAFDAATGTQIWSDQSYFGDASPRLFDLVVSPDASQVFGVGDILLGSQYSQHAIAVAYSADGDRLWTRKLAERGRFGSAEVDPVTGSLLAVGLVFLPEPDFTRVTAVSFSRTGKLRWQRVLPDGGRSVSPVQLDSVAGEAYFGVKGSDSDTYEYYAALVRINPATGRLAIIGRQKVPYFNGGNGDIFSAIDPGRGQGYVVSSYLDTSLRGRWTTAAFSLPESGV